MIPVRRCARKLLMRCIGVALMLWASGAAASDAEAVSVSFDPDTGTLSVQASERPFSEVLERVGAEAGFEVEINQRVDGSVPVTVTFEDLALEAGLKTLLAGKSFALDRRGDARRIAKVWVLSELTRAPAAVAPAPPAAAPGTVMPTLPGPGLGDLPDLTAEQREHIVESLRQYQTSTGKDPRDQLEELRRLVAPDSASLKDVPLEQLPDVLIEMMRGSSPPLTQ